ncbi:MAG: hypothetical protein IKQ71_04015 [Lachnospiraceae bacterium]|nr:hypothetical protein [Lachnospiraceae bacterium]
MRVSSKNDLMVDTERIATCAHTIDTVNKSVAECCKNEPSQIKAILSSWSGPSAQNAKNSIERIIGVFEPDRYDSLNDKVLLLLNQIGEGYEKNEDINKRLADNFK